MEKYQFTYFTCPNVPDYVISWCVGNWFYPSTSEEIDWKTFRSLAELSADVVEASGYLPWQRGWEPFNKFLRRSQAEHHESFYQGTLPSGMPYLVWQSSGIEHFFTPDGNFDPMGEDELLTRAEEVLEEVGEIRKPTLGDVLLAIRSIE